MSTDEAVSIERFSEILHTEALAREWLERCRWPFGVRCALCGGTEIRETADHKPLPWRCIPCRRFFSVRTGTAMNSSRLSYQQWVKAMYVVTAPTPPDRFSSRRLALELDLSQPSALDLRHRICAALDPYTPPTMRTVAAAAAHYFRYDPAEPDEKLAYAARLWAGSPSAPYLPSSEIHAVAFVRDVRWPFNVSCVHCGSSYVQLSANPARGWRCFDCIRYFGVRIGTPLAKSRLDVLVWLVAVYLLIRGDEPPTRYHSKLLREHLLVNEKSATRVMDRLLVGWPSLPSPTMRSFTEAVRQLLDDPRDYTQR